MPNIISILFSKHFSIDHSKKLSGKIYIFFNVPTCKEVPMGKGL